MKKINILIIVIILLVSTSNVYALDRYFSLYDEMEKQAVLDNEASKYVINENGIDFTKPSSDTNGKGVYIDHNSVNSDNKIMYYRGNISNNHTIIENHCWEIIRTTDDNKIKLLYAGKVTNNQCLSEGAALYALPNKVSFNSLNEESNLGYMLPDTDGNPNILDSIIKTEVDKWFNETFTNKKLFKDTIFCNDKTYDASLGHYNGYKRLLEGTPTFACEREEDSYSTTDIGNAKLTYPVALINTDELIFAGAQYNGVEPENYFNSWALVNAAYWSMTPNSSNKILYPNSLGFINRNSITSSSGVRPVVAIDKDVLVTTGDGTKENPYRVATNQDKYQITTEDNIKADMEEAIENQPIELVLEEKEGYILKRIVFEDIDTNEILNIDLIKENNKIYFRMPNKNIKIKTEWTLKSNPITSNKTNIYILIVLLSVLLSTTLFIKKKKYNN